MSKPGQWRFVETKNNPADLATHGVDANKLKESMWLTGPAFLKQLDSPDATPQIALDSNDPELREVKVKKTHATQEMSSARLNKFSSWSRLRHAIALLISKVRRFKRERDKKRESDAGNPEPPTVDELDRATILLLRIVQKEAFLEDTVSLTEAPVQDSASRQSLRKRKNSLKRSRLHALDPFVDEDGILRVGGRLRRSSLEFSEKHPAILPKNHHLSMPLIRHYHESVHHQGRQITHGAVRQAGYWVISGHGAVTKVISACVTCKKSRGAVMTQHMADLPKDRMDMSPPFTNVGLDVFGPWLVSTRRLRGGAANTKRWGLVFTCLSSRAIHIELLESMDANSFICALRRFFALRGPATKIRCDRGTNFIGGKSEVEHALKELDQRKVQKYVTEQGSQWLFNPPHASHFGGVWERQIRTIRSVLDAMLTRVGSSQLTHELLSTLMAEVTGIVNSRPIAAVPSDTADFQPLSPSMILTAKTRPLAPQPGKFVQEDLYARRWWKRAQYLADQFWCRWRREYLQNLQRRTKWTERQPNLTDGDIVLVKQEDSRRNSWPLGRILKAIKSDDGLVRKAQVLMSHGEGTKMLLRPISQLIHLTSTDQVNN